MNELMEGINILNQTTKCTSGYNNFQGGCIAGFSTLFFLLFTILLIKKGEIGIGIGSICICIILGLTSYSNIENYINRIYYQIYQVTLDDNIKYKEFTDKYEVIKQEGKIYTIKLK